MNLAAAAVLGGSLGLACAEAETVPGAPNLARGSAGLNDQPGHGDGDIGDGDGDDDPPPAGRGEMFEGTASPITNFTISLSAGSAHTFRTANCTSGADPMLHALDFPSDVDLGSDKDSGDGNNASFTIPAASQVRTALVIGHTQSNTNSGECDILLDNVKVRRSSFGGFVARLEGLRKSEALEALRLPGGLRAPQLMLLLRNDGVHVQRRVAGGGTEGSARTRLDVAYGTRTVVAGSVLSGTGPIRLVRNDLIGGHDDDGDGLGFELERAIGTCPTHWETTVQGFSCGGVVDLRDTDADGISDGWELLGRRDVGTHQPLAAWGADPRQKDLFFELDFAQRSPGEADVRWNAASVAEFASLFQGTTPASPSSERVDAINEALDNPNGALGFRVHIDTGVNPPNLTDSTFGDWGGHSVVSPVKNENGAWVGQAAANAWPHWMDPARRRIFRYLLGDTAGDGGQCGHFQFFCNVPLVNARTAAHEVGHSFGIGHAGPAWVDHTDPNCKPNYPSLMSYMFQRVAGTGFHDGLFRDPLDNGSLNEGLPITEPAYVADLTNRYQYNMTANGFVDWNRNGVIDAGRVVAYSNYAPGSDCEWTRYSSVKTGVTSAGSVALAQLGSSQYVFFVGDDRDLYSLRTESLPAAPDVTAGGPAPSSVVRRWHAPQITGVAAMPFPGDGPNRLMVVVIFADGSLTEIKLQQTLVGGVVQTNDVGRTYIGGNAAGEPGLTRLPDGRALLAYRGTDGAVRTRLRSVAGWSAETLASSSAGPLPLMAASASPALAFASVPSDSATSFADYVEGTYGAFIDAQSVMHLYRFEAGSGLFQEVLPWDSGAPANATGRPTMAFVPGNASQGRAPRFYLLYLEGTTPDAVPHMRMSFARGLAPNARHKVGLDAPFDNGYLHASGIAVQFDGRDNLRAALPVGDRGNVELRLRADGLTSYPLVGRNDWLALGSGACRDIVHVAGQSPADIVCADWPFQIVPH
jgi:hypothetical protein